MFAGPEMPQRLYNHAIATLPSGDGVVIVGGGYFDGSFYSSEKILKLKFESQDFLQHKWVELPQKIQHQRIAHLAFFSSASNFNCTLNN